jgi:isoleucyl-tRNA synthetase
MIPVPDERFKTQLQAIENLILSEVNVKAIQYLNSDSNILVKKIKANFKELGPKYGKLMKALSAAIAAFTQEDIQALENTGAFDLNVEGQAVSIALTDVEIMTEDIPGWVVSSEDHLTVALDITLTQELIEEGIARELVNRIQNIRKNSNFEVTDKINVEIKSHPEINSAVQNYISYICSETLAANLVLVEIFTEQDYETVELSEEVSVFIRVSKLQQN